MLLNNRLGLTALAAALSLAAPGCIIGETAPVPSYVSAPLSQTNLPDHDSSSGSYWPTGGPGTTASLMPGVSSAASNCGTSGFS